MYFYPFPNPPPFAPLQPQVEEREWNLPPRLPKREVSSHSVYVQNSKP